jgi:CRP-like cAMP-binding protein
MVISLCANSTELVQSFSPRSVLPSRLGYVWRIKAGAVRTMTWLEDGTTVVLGIWGSGGVVGRGLSQVEPYQIECITTVEAIAIPLTTLPNLPEVLFTHVHQAEALNLIRSYKRVDVMLVKFLEWLSQRFGQEVENGQMIDLRLTHLDIADAIGATRVTVTRTLKQLEKQGIIECIPLKRIILHGTGFWHYEI